MLAEPRLGARPERLALGRGEARRIEAIAIVERHDRAQLRRVDPFDPRRRRLRRTPAAAGGVEAPLDQVELGVVARAGREREAPRGLPGTATHAPARVKAPDEHKHERDQEPRRVLADASALAPAPAGEEEPAPGPEVAQGFLDRRLVSLRVGPDRRRRVHVAPGAVHVRERPRVSVSGPDDPPLPEAAPLLPPEPPRVARPHPPRAQQPDRRGGEELAAPGPRAPERPLGLRG